MLAVSPLRSSKDDENQEEMESFSIGNFGDLSDRNLLESINFDDLFDGFNVDGGDILPDLEMDSDIFAEFSVSGGEESVSEINSSSMDQNNNSKVEEEDKENSKKEYEDKTVSSGQEIVSERDDESVVVVNPLPKDGGKGRKSSSQAKNPRQGKRKVKVDWTPELHRRFVQAVEQLGVDKAVPSRILEIMGIDCLTRHNIASHLQKYRSHRKHLLAREAEAASWNQRRQLYGVATSTGVGAGGKRDVSSPWPAAAPTMGFPPPMTTMHHFRPLHVWGHPSMDQSFMHMWPKHLQHSPPPLSWTPAGAPPPPQDPSFWQAQHQRDPSAVIPGAPCFPQPLTTAGFGCPPVPGIPPHTMYNKANHGIGAPAPAPGPFFDFHPSRESIDAAIGDVLSKPWLPLPLGLKAPALDSVMGELQRQGISNFPPTSCT